MAEEIDQDIEVPVADRRRTAVYASPLILARRHRILNEVRKMIASDGIANLSMDEVSRRAQVAKRTLYNAFQSKERLIAAAIQQYFEDYADSITYSTEEATLERALERLVVVARRNLPIRHYTGALMAIYFSHDADPEIRQTIHNIAANSHEPLIRKLAERRQLQSWVDPDDFIASMARVRYSVAHAWAEGLISDDQFLFNLPNTFLTYLAGATRGSTRKQVEAMLKNLSDLPLIKAALSRA